MYLNNRLESKFTHFEDGDYNPEFGRFISEDPIGFAGGDPNLFRALANDPINKIDPYGFDSYRTNFGHGFLVIDDPSGSGGVFIFTFGPTDPSVATYFQALTGTDLPAEAKMAFFPKGSDLWFLGVEVPLSRIEQTPEQDQETIERARRFIDDTANGDNVYNFLNLGEDGYNCIGAARKVQCGNKCGGR